jgi:hypothetical protein
MMLGKKGQLSVYVIGGMVLLIIVLLAINVETETLKKDIPPDVSLATKIVRAGVTTCLKEAAKEALIFTASRGGYLIPPDEYVDFTGEESFQVASIPYFQVEDTLIFPTIKTVQESIAGFIETSIKNCTSIINVPDHDLVFGDTMVTVRMHDTLMPVQITMQMPTTLRSLETERETTINNFATTVESQISQALSISKNVIESNKNDLCLTCLATHTPQDMELIVFDTNQPPFYIVIYQLLYNETFDNEKKPAAFKFAARYATDQHEYEPKVRIISENELGNLTAVVNKPFVYNVKTDANQEYRQARGATFSDTSDDFNINPSTGQISYTPKQAGGYLFEITVTDSTGEWDSALAKLEVMDEVQND